MPYRAEGTAELHDNCLGSSLQATHYMCSISFFRFNKILITTALNTM